MTKTTTEKLAAALAYSPFMANVTAALESKSNIALILGVMDNCGTIREMFGLVSCDGALQNIEQMLHERFGDCTVRLGDAFLILMTGDRATKAVEIAESVRATVEIISPALDERFLVTMHFGVARASSQWTNENGFCEMLRSADEAILAGQTKLIANRVYEPTGILE
jgi:diguanylate cyclase (GGDEF)-like protein